MVKTREFKNVESVSLFRDVKRCYPIIKGEALSRGIDNCKVIETRNADVIYSRDMSSASLMNFKKPVTCYYNPKDGFLFCGTYRSK